MAEDPQIVELTSAAEMAEAFDCMTELRTHLTRDSFDALLADMRPDGYRLFAARSHGRIVALAGIGIGTNFYYGRYLWVYDLITTAAARSRGFGAALLGYLEDLARSERCDTIALASGVKRIDAHRFYEDKMGFERASFTFKKDLGDRPFAPTPDPKAT